MPPTIDAQFGEAILPAVDATHKYLSPFQVAKFSYMFNAFFDIEKNDLIEYDDFIAFGERLCEFTGWTKDSVRWHSLQDILRTFHECVKDQVKLEYLAEETNDEDSKITWEEADKRYKEVQFNQKTTMNLKQWLNMWGRLCYGASGISDFPIWVQLLPELFFQVADRDADGIISKAEIKNFYEILSGIKDPVTLQKTTNEGYRALTANENYKLNKQNYSFAFANFLLAKNIYGPGKYIFGTFDNREIDEQYKVIYTDEAEKDEN